MPTRPPLFLDFFGIDRMNDNIQRRILFFEFKERPRDMVVGCDKPDGFDIVFFDPVFCFKSISDGV